MYIHAHLSIRTQVGINKRVSAAVFAVATAVVASHL